jgi:hypothetical protein
LKSEKYLILVIVLISLMDVTINSSGAFLWAPREENACVFFVILIFFKVTPSLVPDILNHRDASDSQEKKHSEGGC